MKPRAQILRKDVGDTRVLRFLGELYFGSGANLLHQEIEQMLEEGTPEGFNAVLNLEGLTSFDSAGIGELVSAHASVVEAGGTLIVTNLPPKLNGKLSIELLLLTLNIEETEEIALRACGGNTLPASEIGTAG